MKKIAVLTLYVVLCLLPLSAGADTEEFRAPIGDDGVQRVQITAGSYFFNPKHIVVKVNTPVEFSARREAGLVPHNITLHAPEAGIDFSESLGADPITIRFAPTKAGTYAFFCNKKPIFAKSHREKGMEGTLEVLP